MADAVRELMGDAYPELREPSFARVLPMILSEETRFGHTLDIGLKKLEAHLSLWTPEALERARALSTERPLIGPFELRI